jgi:hypothetical protein
MRNGGERRAGLRRQATAIVIGAREARRFTTGEAERGGTQQTADAAKSERAGHEHTHGQHRTGGRQRHQWWERGRRQKSPTSDTSRRQRRQRLAALTARQQPAKAAAGHATGEQPSCRHGDEFAGPEELGGDESRGEAEREGAGRECRESDALGERHAEQATKPSTVVHTRTSRGRERNAALGGRHVNVRGVTARRNRPTDRGSDHASGMAWGIRHGPRYSRRKASCWTATAGGPSS